MMILVTEMKGYRIAFEILMEFPTDDRTIADDDFGDRNEELQNCFWDFDEIPRG
ncbi:MAG: hypothetical protein ONB37_04645 [candidate division KSB1 bacterium]|nr:hypothetical protein [candidate division KSB1 bacterium]